MIYDATKPGPGTEPKTVTLADGQTFSLIVRRPTLADRINADGLQALAYAGVVKDGWANLNFARFEAVIIGWSDVMEPGDPEPKPVAFSQDKLRGLMDSFPEIVKQVQTIAAGQFAVFQKGSAGN